jgi:hypothetical protein
MIWCLAKHKTLSINTRKKTQYPLLSQHLFKIMKIFSIAIINTHNGIYFIH